MLLDMKHAPCGMPITVALKTGGRVVLEYFDDATLGDDATEGWYSEESTYYRSRDLLGWWPIGDKWLDPAVVPPIEGVDIVATLKPYTLGRKKNTFHICPGLYVFRWHPGGFPNSLGEDNDPCWGYSWLGSGGGGKVAKEVIAAIEKWLPLPGEGGA